MVKQEIVKLLDAKRGNKRLAKESMALWQEIVKMRANYRCEYPGCRRAGKLDAHHVFRRQHRSTLYDPDNGIALCPQHHSLGAESAHHDPSFKDKILGRFPGYRAIRTEQWFTLLERKAWAPHKLDLNLERLYLEKIRQEMAGQGKLV